MTNYEWLVKTGRLAMFLHTVRYDDLQSREIAEDLKRDYNIDLVWGCNICEKLAEWLRVEHRSVEKYVRLRDVLNIMNTPTSISIEEEDGMVSLKEMRRVLGEDFKDKMDRLGALKSIEIKEKGVDEKE